MTSPVARPAALTRGALRQDALTEEQRVVAARTRQALADLTREDRLVIIETCYRGRTPHEVAALLGVTEERVRLLAHHAVHTLRTALDTPAAAA